MTNIRNVGEMSKYLLEIPSMNIDEVQFEKYALFGDSEGKINMPSGKQYIKISSVQRHVLNNIRDVYNYRFFHYSFFTSFDIFWYR